MRPVLAGVKGCFVTNFHNIGVERKFLEEVARTEKREDQAREAAKRPEEERRKQ